MNNSQFKFGIVADLTLSKAYAKLKEQIESDKNIDSTTIDTFAVNVEKLSNDHENYFKILSNTFYNDQEILLSIVIVKLDLELGTAITKIHLPYIPCNEMPSKEVLTYLKAYDCGGTVVDIASGDPVWSVND